MTPPILDISKQSVLIFQLQGQVEYEMPLLAPPAPANNDQRKGNPMQNSKKLELEDETPELPEEKAERPEFVHIATKRR